MGEPIKHAIYSHAEVMRTLDKLKVIFKAAGSRGLTMADVILQAKTEEEEALFRTAFTLTMEHKDRFVAGFKRIIYERLDEHRHRIEIQ